MLPEFVNNCIINFQYAIISRYINAYIVDYNYFAGAVNKGKLISELVKPCNVIGISNSTRESCKFIKETIKCVSRGYHNQGRCAIP